MDLDWRRWHLYAWRSGVWRPQHSDSLARRCMHHTRGDFTEDGINQLTWLPNRFSTSSPYLFGTTILLLDLLISYFLLAKKAGLQNY